MAQLKAKPTPEDFAFSRLISYAAYQWPEYKDAPHHRLIARKLEALERGEITRLVISMPPRHGKTMLASEFFPAWYIGRNPDHYVVVSSYGQDLADDIGRKVKNQIEDAAFAGIFPGVGLADDSRSAKRFHVKQDNLTLEGGYEYQLSQPGAFYAVGIGGPLTGRGAHLLLIDDPVKSRKDADSDLIRKDIRDWYTSTAYTRLMPGGRIVLIQCMTGDTPVRMADGSERQLRNIRPGDNVATYRNGELSSAVVRNWRSSGLDRVFTIKTASGASVRANDRHPFLVLEDGEPRWIRTKDLRRGHRIYRVNGASGRARLACGKAAKSRQKLAAIASHITTKKGGLTAFARHLSILHRTVARTLNTATVLLLTNITGCSPLRTASAPYAGSRPEEMSGRIGAASSASITAMIRKKLERFFVTTAISPWGTPKRQKPRSPSPNTSDFILDNVDEITFDGVEEVFDIEVEGTENFIANGLVSHNTRWHESDLAGWLIKEHAHEGWDVLTLPAISPDGKALWPEQYDLPALLRIKQAIGPRDWSALYQQEPTPDTGDYFKREWLMPVPNLPPLESLRIYGGSDYAVTAGGGDYTVHAVLGLDSDGNPWLMDLWREQTSSDVWVSAFCDLVRKWKPMGWAEEKGQINSGVGPWLERDMRERKAYVAREQFPTKGDKAVRAQSFRGLIATRGLRYLDNAPWRAELENEMMRFPAGVHDDMVDALGLIGQLLDTAIGPAKKKPEDAKPKAGYAPQYRSMNNEGFDVLTI